jgi:hypothetical protein
MRQKTNRDSERLVMNFRTTLTWLVVVASPIRPTRWPAIAVRTIFSAFRLARSSAFPITIAIPRPIVAAPAGLGFFAFEIGIVVRTRGLIGPGGQHSQVEQVFRWRRRRH